MLTLAQAFFEAFNEIDDKFVVEAIEYQCRKTKRIQLKWVVVAAAVIVGLTAVAMAANFLGIKDLLLPSKQANLSDNEIIQTMPVGETISLSGYMNTPESRALAEWTAFLERYDSDGAILDSAGNHLDESMRRYVGYLVYTQEMADELERIADKYGLKLHTEQFDLFAYPELLASCEGYLGQNRGAATYMYEDGSFHVDGTASIADFGIVDFQLQRCVRGTLHDVTLSIMDVADYQEWEYKTSCGTSVVLALGIGKALILADLDDSFVTVNCLAGTNSGMTAEHLEELADSFDFTKLDPVVVPDLADIPDDTAPVGTPASAYTTARKTYAAVLRELLYTNILPDGTQAERLGDEDMSLNRFAVLDVSGDEKEELILLFTTAITAGQRGMVIAFDETYTGIARPVSIPLDEYPMLIFYDNGYIMANAAHNQTWGELLPYTLYDDNFSVVAYVSSQDKHIMEAAGKGDEYPDAIDVSGTGTVYQVGFPYGSDTSAGVYFWDAAEYEAWLERTLGEAKELMIPYQALTEENISRMESQ